MIKVYKKIFTKEFDLESFKKIVSKNFSIFTSNNEIIEKKVDSENFKFSKNLPEIKRQLMGNFNLFLEGHTETLTSLALTSDDKYIISGSEDKTVRIWNRSEKRQEAVLKGHTDYVLTVAVTSDNKYIISGCGGCEYDNVIIIWSLLEKKSG